MPLVKWAFIGLLLLPVTEVAAFVVVAALIGWLWAACLFLATTVFGVLILRRSGRQDLERFRNEFSREGIYAIHLESPGLGPVIAGILLVLPGFMTDVLGLLLLAPAVRRRLRATIGHAAERARRPRDPAVIDLTPEEWHQVSDRTVEGRRKRRRRQAK